MPHEIFKDLPSSEEVTSFVEKMSPLLQTTPGLAAAITEFVEKAQQLLPPPTNRLFDRDAAWYQTTQIVGTLLKPPSWTVVGSLEAFPRLAGVGHAFVIHGPSKRVLLSQRSANMREFPGTWTPPAGNWDYHLDATLIDTAEREFLEETNQAFSSYIKDEQPFLTTFATHPVYGGHVDRRDVNVFCCIWVEEALIPPTNPEVSAWRWVAEHELDTPEFPLGFPSVYLEPTQRLFESL